MKIAFAGRLLGATLFSLILMFPFLALATPKAQTLRWGADSESGAPYAFKDPQNFDRLIGFEVDLVGALAREMEMEPQFVQNSWEGLVEGLKRKDYDIVVNGLEITEDRREVVHFSTPYYITSAILTVRKNNFDIHGLKDLEGRRVGTLDGALAERILQQRQGIKVLTYDEEIHAYNDLSLERLDAVLLDEPIALYYAKPKMDLKNVGGPIGRLEYGIAVRLEDRDLLRKINISLQKLIESGELRAILEKWGMWNQLSAQAWGQDSSPQTPATSYEEYLVASGQKRTVKDKLLQYLSFLPMLGKGAIITLELSVVAMALAILVGLMTALARLYGPAPLRWLALAFVEIFRGTPLLIQLYLIFYGLPHLGIRLDPFFAAVMGLGLNYGACEAENYRAGILAIPKSQMDASQALGMSRRQALRHIILPQAVRMVIPPVTNDFIALLKDSSLVSVITMVELTTIYGQLASTYFDYLGIGLLAAAMYFVIGLPFVRLSRYFESRLAYDKIRSVKGVRGAAEMNGSPQPA